MSLKKTNIHAEHLPVDLLKEILELDADTGVLTWRRRPVRHFSEGKPTPKMRAAMWNGKYAGKQAFTSSDPRGYFRGAIGGKFFYAHRVIVALTDGEWPWGEVDHINRDKSDNRRLNLRVVTHAENRRNSADCDPEQRGAVL